MFTKTETTIKFNKRNFKVRMLNIMDLGLVNICSTVLNRLLVSAEGEYVSEEAKYIDDQIFYFISPSDFRLPDKELACKILKDIN